MKYIFDMIFKTLAFLVVFPAIFLLGLWKFQFAPLKELWNSYSECMSVDLYKIKRQF